MKHYSFKFLILTILLIQTYNLFSKDNELDKYEEFKNTKENIDYSYIKLNKKTNKIFESDYIENQEVLYFFSYDCIKCNETYSYITAWEEFIKPINVNIERIPISTKNKKDHLSKLFFIRDNLNFNNRFDNEIFKGVKLNKLSIENDQDVLYIFETYFNIDSKNIEEKIKSEQINKKIEISNNLYKHYSEIIDNVELPIIVVNKGYRTYIITPKNNNNDVSMFLSLNHIIFQL